jgi:hypothetical protein
MNSDKIKQEAKQVLDKFAKALEKVEKEHDIEACVDREIFERKEGNSRDYDKNFKKKILENAPQHDDDFIIAETKGW